MSKPKAMNGLMVAGLLLALTCTTPTGAAASLGACDAGERACLEEGSEGDPLCEEGRSSGRSGTDATVDSVPGIVRAGGYETCSRNDRLESATAEDGVYAAAELPSPRRVTGHPFLEADAAWTEREQADRHGRTGTTTLGAGLELRPTRAQRVDVGAAWTETREGETGTCGVHAYAEDRTGNGGSLEANCPLGAPPAPPELAWGHLLG